MVGAEASVLSQSGTTQCHKSKVRYLIDSASLIGTRYSAASRESRLKPESNLAIKARYDTKAWESFSGRHFRPTFQADTLR